MQAFFSKTYSLKKEEQDQAQNILLLILNNFFLQLK